MRAFDSSSYVKAVLAPAVASGTVPDMFARYCLNPADYVAGASNGEETRDAIVGRLEEVKTHWDTLQGRNNVKYEEILKRLLHEHGAAKLTLLDSDALRKAADESRAAQSKSEADRREQEERFEKELTEALARNKGLTARSRRMLEEYARHLKLDPAAVSARLDSCPTAAERTDSEALPENIRASIRAALVVYAAAVGNPAKGVSLFHALGFTEPEFDHGALEAACARVSGELRKLGSDHPVNTPLKAVLGFATVHLVEADPAIYMASLVLDVREALRPMAAGHAIDDDAIDELEAEQLVREAQELGLPAHQARDLVADLASDLNVRLVMGSAVDYIACPHCNRPHPAVGAPDRCSRCGGELFRNCPTCQTRCPASDTACSSCGTDLATYALSQRRISEARLAVESGHLSMAAALLADLPAEPADESRKELLAEIERRLRQARSEWEVIERKIGERNLHAAVYQLTQLEQRAADVAGPSGLSSSERLATIAERLRKVESLLARAQGESGAAREQSLAAALEEAADCREAENELARIQPLPVRELRAIERGGQLCVEWSPSLSPGPIVYHVVRSSASSDTEIVVAGSRAVTDKDAPVGEVVRYGLTSERAGTRSETIWSGPILLAREIQGLSVIERDGEVELSWEPVAAHARVEVERTDEDSGRCVQLRPDHRGVLDRDVQNGGSYRYRVRVVYPGVDGHLTRTDGSTVFGRPAHRPGAVDDLGATMDGALVRFRYSTPDRGSVSILRCHDRPSVEEGQDLTQAELDAAGVLLPHDKNGPYDSDPTSLAWYLPVSQSGSYLVAGRPIRYLGLPPITDVQAVDLGSRVRVTWSWPDRTRAAVVAWRRDRQPVDADDEHAQRLTVTKAQYTEHGGVELDTPNNEPVFLAVFPAARLDGELVAAAEADRRARVNVRKTEKVEVGYAVRRSGLRKRQVMLEIFEPADVLPELVVVAKSGELLPRTVSDGRIIAHLGGRSGSRQQGFDLGELGRPVAVRVFFESLATDSTHKLRDPSTRELVFR